MGSMKEVGDVLIASVKQYVGDALSGVTHRLDEFDARLKAIPAGPKGDPGESIKGEPGDRGEPGESVRIEDVQPLIADEVQKAVLAERERQTLISQEMADDFVKGLAEYVA